MVNGDLNVGGIVGTMNIEYDLDPEFDPDLTDSTDITLRSTVNNVVIRCSNYGEVTSKKNSVGGITGLEELGLVYGSESYCIKDGDDNLFMKGYLTSNFYIRQCC